MKGSDSNKICEWATNWKTTYRLGDFNEHVRKHDKGFEGMHKVNQIKEMWMEQDCWCVVMKKSCAWLTRSSKRVIENNL